MRKARPLCHSCGERMKPIVYGFPDESLMESKDVILGGCMVESNDPQWGCDCEDEEEFADFEIVVGDITTLNVDVIVNAANSELLAGGGVCGAIHDAAGAELETYSRAKYPEGVQPGNAVVTPGFNSKAKYIVHAVAPRFQITGQSGLGLLIDAYMNAILAADSTGSGSVAIPSLGTGIYGWKVADVAPFVLHAGILSLQNHLKSIRKITLCCFSEEDAHLYRASLAG